MQWFKHDTNATTDAKIKKLILKYGAEGYAIYFHCLELIASDITPNNVNFQLEHDSEIIADNLKIKSDNEFTAIDKVNNIMKYIIELKLFENNNNIITCFKIAKRLDKSMTSNAQMRQIIENCKQNSTNHDIVMTNHDAVMETHARREEIRRDKKRIDQIDKKRIEDVRQKPDALSRKKTKTNLFKKYEQEITNIITHLNKLNDTNYKPFSNSSSYITARLEDGYTEEDLIKVIDIKTKDWKNDAKMHMYLRPSTLFRPEKFEAYLNQKTEIKPKKREYPKNEGLEDIEF